MALFIEGLLVLLFGIDLGFQQRPWWRDGVYGLVFMQLRLPVLWGFPATGHFSWSWRFCRSNSRQRVENALHLVQGPSWNMGLVYRGDAFDHPRLDVSLHLGELPGWALCICWFLRGIHGHQISFLHWTWWSVAALCDNHILHVGMPAGGPGGDVCPSR